MRSRGLWIVPAVAIFGCKPDEGAFHRKTFFCQASDHRSQCGTTKDGAPLICFGGKQLGAGRDFCVEPCTAEEADRGSAEFVCLAGAKLTTCRPSEKTADDPDGCGPDLACLRTDLARDEGVCLAIRVCSADTDCIDPLLSTCGSSIVKTWFPKAPYIATNLQCLMSGCKTRLCPHGESCLPKEAPDTPVPDICVPTCDSNLNCPPNYACWRKFSGPAGPNVCLPTLAGTRCASSLDCLVGDCLDTGEGFSLCSVPCESNADCALISETWRRLVCVPVRKDQKYCMAITSFAGPLCNMDRDCDPDKKCYWSSPASPEPMAVPMSPAPRGECRLPCGPEARCPVRAGIAHACLVRGADRSCYPGTLGVTCQRSDECLSGLTCQALAPGAGSACTRPCTSDVDCLDDWNSQEGYCEAGWCRLGIASGGSCTRDQQCGDQRCNPVDGGTTRVCAPP